MGTKPKPVGFDRSIQLGWLDATADWAAQGLPVGDIRERLEELLVGKVAGTGPHSARGKTMTVLLHIWVLVPAPLGPLRDDALDFVRVLSGRDRLAVHWGMCMATYPFFHDVTASVGRLLQLQGSVALSQIKRRVAETWGERSTVVRATQRVIRSLVSWGVLRETGERGVFAATPRIDLASAGPGAWLVEAAISGSDHRARPLRSLLSSATFFPFELHLSRREVAANRRLEIHRQGLDEDLVALRS